jgi:glucuronate isomerase
MKTFLDHDFLLQSHTARTLYHENAAALPIIDYHCHLDPQQIADDRQFENLSRLWLEGDHYKWRLMRACGVSERYITGSDSSDYEKFQHWAAVIPHVMGNPMYHWVHMELKSAFGITQILKPQTARQIYDQCTAMLQTPAYSARSLMRKYKVEAVCTTDDPVDSLMAHKMLAASDFEVKVLPTWRPDKAMNIENPAALRTYIEQLSAASGVSIHTYDDLLQAMQNRHDAFAQAGCRLSDHGLSEFYADDYTETEIKNIFNMAYAGKAVPEPQQRKFKSDMLYQGALMDYNAGWTQQFHYGALRNNNSRLLRTIGADAGADSIGDCSTAQALSKFLNRLDEHGKLAKTIIYNLNPRDNAMLAAMTGNFQDGSIGGKVQFGAAWWFLDNKSGMENHLTTLSEIGCLSQFVGMLTDSRSFLSYPRHDYFRRILCNMLGSQVEHGLLPSSEMDTIAQMTQNICYYNAKRYFQF